MPVFDGDVITFTDKFRYEHTGIIASINWQDGEYSVTVRCTTGTVVNGEFFTHNHDLSLKTVEKILKKKIDKPAPPKFN